MRPLDMNDFYQNFFNYNNWWYQTRRHWFGAISWSLSPSLISSVGSSIMTVSIFLVNSRFNHWIFLNTYLLSHNLFRYSLENGKNLCVVSLNIDTTTLNQLETLNPNIGKRGKSKIWNQLKIFSETRKNLNNWRSSENANYLLSHDSQQFNVNCLVCSLLEKTWKLLSNASFSILFNVISEYINGGLFWIIIIKHQFFTDLFENDRLFIFLVPLFFHFLFSINRFVALV